MRRSLGILLLVAFPAAARAAEGTVQAVTSFGANPGALDMYEYVPPGTAPGAPLVVFMHGCTQPATDAAKTGWNELADEYGFVVVYPQQRSANNPVTCFNWAGEYGDPANLVRGQGENASIKSMVDYMIAEHGVDPERVYVAGFSAGGAFAAVMLATWPDVFQAGALMSGIPYRCATTVNTAYSCQQLDSHPELMRTPDEWGDLVRAAHPGFAGPYPRVILFHGANDFTVQPTASAELVEQWTDVLGTDQTADDVATIGGHERRRFVQGGAVVVESWRIASMGHAVTMGGADPAHPCPPMGGTYIEDRGICAAYRAAEFFGLVGVPPVGGGPDGGPIIGGGPDAGPEDPPPPLPPGAPQVTITAPTSGDTVSGIVTLEATASDDTGIARVEFWVDGVLKGSDGAAPYTQVWQTANYADGEHEVEAIAYDVYEVSASDSVMVTIAAGGVGLDGDPMYDPIPCGCRAAAAGARGGGLAALALLLALFVRRGGRR